MHPATSEAPRIDGATIRRFLNPRSVAVVGASPTSRRHAVHALLGSGLDVHLVNPRYDEIFGHPAYPDLASIGGPIDAVLTLVNARIAVDAVEQAAAVGAAGVAINAAGFAEAGPEGTALQQRLVRAATDLAVLGPNCNGFVNAQTGAFLAGAPQLPLRAGSVGFVTHSGGFITDVAVAAANRQVGFSALISTGNEAVTDMIDYLDYLVDDPTTAAICLVIERIRRPEAFFAAAERARLAGKPVVALKLGRSSRGREVAKSHTGAILGASWTYDAAFKQFGIISAHDLGDMLDRVMFFDQLPRRRWSSVQKPAILSVSGGAAALASDISEDEGLHLPELQSVRGAVNGVLPDASVMNPIDLTGFVMENPPVMRSVFTTYAESPDVDTLMALWTTGIEDRAFAQAFVLPFAEMAGRTTKVAVLSMIADGPVSAWAADLMAQHVAIGHGLRGSLRGLSSMKQFMAAHSRPARVLAPAPERSSLNRDDVVEVGGHHLLTFSAAMQLLARHGIPVAPYTVVGATDDVGPPTDFEAPYVVKLADCAHRTDIGAVRIGVTDQGLHQAVRDMRALAAEHGLPDRVAIQPMLSSDGEAFLGADTSGDLGPMVVCGLGGIHVEALGKVNGRLAPMTELEVEDLVEDLDGIGVFTGARGQEPWDRTAFGQVISAATELTLAAQDWMLSLDINPLMHTPAGFVAVDALIFAHPDPSDDDVSHD